MTQLDDTKTDETAAETKEASGVKLTPAQWSDVVEKWEFGQHSLAELAAEYGTSKSNLSQYFKRRGITKGSREKEFLANKRAEEQKNARAGIAPTVAAVAANSPALAQKIEDFLSQRLDRIEETRESYYKFFDLLAKLTVKKVQDQLKAGMPMEALDGEFKAIRRATDILAITRRERWEILNVDSVLDQDEAIPVLEVRELFEREVGALRDADEDDYDVSVDLNLDPLSGAKLEDPDDIIETA